MDQDIDKKKKKKLKSLLMHFRFVVMTCNLCMPCLVGRVQHMIAEFLGMLLQTLID